MKLRNLCLWAIMGLLFSQCKSDTEVVPSTTILTQEQIKSLVGATWEISSHSGSYTLTGAGNYSKTVNSKEQADYFQKLKFKDITALEITGNFPETVTYTITNGNTIFLKSKSNNVNTFDEIYFKISINGNTMTWILDKEEILKVLPKEFTVSNADSKFIFQKK